MGFFEINGVLPPVITPFREDGTVDYEKFVSNIEQWNQVDLAGYLVLGSNGETPYLTEQEKEELIRLAAQHAAPGRIIMAGTGLESTAATIALTNQAADLGADCALVLTPNYYGSEMGDAAQIAYFTEVADQSKIPILLYNVSKFTHITLSPSVVRQLSKHPNIIGIKDSSGNIGQMVSYQLCGIDKEFNLLVGTASVWYPALAIGIRGAVMALANCCPQECVAVQRLFEEGKLQESLALYQQIFPVNAAVTGKFGVSGLKYACDAAGYQGGRCRKPLHPLKEEARLELDTILKKAGIKQ